MLYKSKTFELLELLDISGIFLGIVVWAQEAVLSIFVSCDYIRLLGTGFVQVMYLGRAPHTKETLPDFLKWRRVTQHPLVFRGLTGSQQTPGLGRHSLVSEPRYMAT